MKFGIVAAENSRAGKLAGEIKKYLIHHGQKVAKELTGSDLVVVLGGDGTMIHAACENVKLNVPFVGINVGTLGFLTAAEESGWQEAVEKLIDGKYVVSERMTLEASVQPGLHLRGEVEAAAGSHLEGGIGGGQYRALNEIVVKGMYRVVNLEILVNSQKFLSIRGDGVIVSTQTGSTAYSLSAGGPMVDPEVDCFLITPVNAHGLPIPSVVVAPDDVVEIKVVKGEDVSLIVDGQEHMKVSMGQSVKVSMGKHRVKLGYFDKHHFLKALNAKFGLGSRNVDTGN